MESLVVLVVGVVVVVMLAIAISVDLRRWPSFYGGSEQAMEVASKWSLFLLGMTLTSFVCLVWRRYYVARRGQT